MRIDNGLLHDLMKYDLNVLASLVLLLMPPE